MIKYQHRKNAFDKETLEKRAQRARRQPFAVWYGVSAQPCVCNVSAMWVCTITGSIRAHNNIAD